MLCKCYQLVVSTTINYFKRIMMERGKYLYELTDIKLCIVFSNPQNKG
jgi:hypothetical protein